MLLVVGVGVVAAFRFRSRRAERTILTAGVGLLLVATAPLTVAWGIWSVAAVRCGHPPVAANRFAAAYMYDLPGESGYSPGIFPIILPDYYCTEADAKEHGFQHDSRP